MDDGTSPSTVLIQSPGPTHQPTTPTSQPFQIMLGAYSSPYMYHNPYMFPFLSLIPNWNAWLVSSSFPITLTQHPIYRLSSHERFHKAPSGSSSYYQSPSSYGIQTPPPWVMQTTLHSFSIKVGHPPNTHKQNPCRSNYNSHRSNYNPRRKLNQGGIQRVIVDDPHVALIPTSTNIFLIYLYNFFMLFHLIK
ncbi:hypothetical protein J1N35_041034 [Gossypium stocksii]|uniref:Uncharacterized protein n=1 Tax=Gossypium stocksii TaxID=47602 RepID=A0A9D3UEQ2_9ROSI|nr:hypothetical protein J1N35_041034 [Gossypium stocksii]